MELFNVMFFLRGKSKIGIRRWFFLSWDVVVIEWCCMCKKNEEFMNYLFYFTVKLLVIFGFTFLVYLR